MKPFFLMLLLIASGTLIAILSRPITRVAEAFRNLGRLPDRLKAKLLTANGALPDAGRGGRAYQSLHH